MQFQIGDEVLVGENGRWCAGMFGIVVGVEHDGYEVEVEFPGATEGGHRGNSEEDGVYNRWFFYDDGEPSADSVDNLTVITPIAKPAALAKAGQAYLGNGKHTYEHVYATDDSVVDRLRVPGGWLYRTVTDVEFFGEDTGSTVNVVFVPMPEVVKHKV